MGKGRKAPKDPKAGEGVEVPPLSLFVRLNLLGIVGFIALSFYAMWAMIAARIDGQAIPDWAEPFGMLSGTIAIALAAFHFGLLGLQQRK